MKINKENLILVKQNAEESYMYNVAFIAAYTEKQGQLAGLEL